MQPAALFAALADPTRCRMVEMLHEQARPVHELAAAFAISRPAISRHLRVLKQAGLVAEERRGRENVYALVREPMRPLVAWLERQGARGPELRVTAELERPRAKRVADPVPQLAFDL